MMSGVGRRPERAGRQRDAAGVGQSDVEQDQVDRRLVGRRIGGGSHRVAGGMGDRHH